LAKKENLSPSSLLPSQKVPSCLKLGSYGFSNFKVDKILCTLEIFGKIKLVAAHSSLQLSVASTLYTSLLHHLATALHACHAALRYFPPPNLIFLLLVASSHFSSPPARQAGRAKLMLLLLQLALLCCRCHFALLLRCLLVAAAALLCCCATICLTPVLLLFYLLAAAAGEPEPPLPFQAAAKVERQRRPSNALCTGPRRPILHRRATLVTVLHAGDLPWGCCCHDSRVSDKRQPLKSFFSSEPLLSGEDSLHFPRSAGEQLLVSFYCDWSRATESSMPSRGEQHAQHHA
jgi:hypothetical protein